MELLMLGCKISKNCMRKFALGVQNLAQEKVVIRFSSKGMSAFRVFTIFMFKT